MSSVTETQLRRAAARQGLRVVKARTRNERAVDWHTYALVDLATNIVEAGPGMDLTDLAAALAEGGVQ